MTIPLDRLYHYIDQMAEEIHGNSVIIYRFFPYGSKKFTDLTRLKNPPVFWKKVKITPEIFCNDQEPLNYDLYQNISEEQLKVSPLLITLKKYGLVVPRKNFRVYTNSIWDHAVLIHSEQRSEEIAKYKNSDFLPVYYWSHAVISRDWFRYAEHVDQQKNSNKTFLIYSRGWTGTREYRLKFLELIATNELCNKCQIVIQPVDIDSATHYRQYAFINTQWQPKIDLEKYFPTADISANNSADFDLQDYESTDIELVLETLFDDPRLHFTEKILRPIALAQPFILVGSYGGLEYLKQYGFKTFSTIWSEEYDSITDPGERLQAVIDLAKSITNWTPWQKNLLMKKARAIANYNKKRFFSKEFFEQIVGELTTNLRSAFTELQINNTGQIFYNHWQEFKDNTLIQNELLKIRSQQDANDLYNIVLQYRQQNLGKLSNQ
jgi:hypothetical protein